MKAWDKATCAFPDEDVEIRPDGLIYLPHERLRNRLNEAFGAGWYRFLPAAKSVVLNGEILWLYQLSFRDGTESQGVGHARYHENNQNASYGDALETAKSDAFTRCCKDLGIGLQVWNRDYQIGWIRTYAIQVPMLAGNKTQWRRKDRPPLPGERLSERQQGPDYVPRETLDQANRSHFDSLNPSPAAQRFDKQLKAVSREEATWEPEDDEQLRRLHELEEAAFSDEARED